MLETAEITTMRADLEDSLPDTCTVKSVSYVNSGRGRAKTYSDSATGIACRVGALTQRGASEATIAGKVQGRTSYVITLPFGTVIQNDYRIVVTGGDTYEVTGTLEWGTWTLGLRVQCEKIGQED